MEDVTKHHISTKVTTEERDKLRELAREDRRSTGQELAHLICVEHDRRREAARQRAHMEMVRARTMQEQMQEDAA